jgi:hypothetical protein
MDTVKQHPAVAANDHRWPAAAASELVTSGHIRAYYSEEASSTIFYCSLASHGILCDVSG